MADYLPHDPSRCQTCIRLAREEAMTYVKIASWHVVTFTDRGGGLRTRCGRRARVEGTISAGPNGPTEVSPTSPVLPVNERTCERCLALTASDGDPIVGELENDTVDEPVDNDEVPS